LDERSVKEQEGFALSKAPGRLADGAGGDQYPEISAGMQEGAVEVADHCRSYRMPPALALDDGAQARAG
jgi:hypothetical protein